MSRGVSGSWIRRGMAVMPKYLLIKRGLYYRPNNMGYTGIKDQAGRYEASEAYEGVTAIHEDEAPEYAPACWNDVKIGDMQAKLDAITAQRDRLIAALTPDRDTKAAYCGKVRYIGDDGHSRVMKWRDIQAVMAMIRKEAGL